MEENKKNMFKGFVYYYNKERLFGFIDVLSEQKRVFFHINDVLNPEFMRFGANVEFESIYETPKGWCAENVCVLEKQCELN